MSEHTEMARNLARFAASLWERCCEGEDLTQNDLIDFFDEHGLLQNDVATKEDEIESEGGVMAGEAMQSIHTDVVRIAGNTDAAQSLRRG